MKYRPHNLLLFISVITGSLLCASTGLSEPKLVWSDEFDVPGLPDKTKWSYDSGILGYNQELQYYSDSRTRNSRVDENGVLIIEAHKETSPETPFGQTADYTSARLVTKAKGDWQYGRFEVRAKLPSGRGTWPAIWMLPTLNTYGGWPNSGEIDIMEHVGSHMGEVLSTLHFSTRSGGKGPTRKIMVENVDTEFHVYAAEWRPEEIRFFVDGKCYHILEDPQTGWQDWPFDQPFHIILNIAVGGTLGGKLGVDPDIWPQRMEVDYVRVYDLGDSPKLDHDGDGREDAEDPDDDNDGFSDVEEMNAGSNPHQGDSTPETLLTLLKEGSNSGPDQWYKRTQTFSAEGEIVGDAIGPVSKDELSLDAEGSMVFKGSESESIRVNTSLFQATDIGNGLEPGQVITFMGQATADVPEDGKAEAFIVAYTATGGFHHTSVSMPIDANAGAFSLTTTLEKGPVRGVALGFTTSVPAGKSCRIIFSDLAYSLEKQ